jgi:predicted outer membrane repeat protein
MLGAGVLALLPNAAISRENRDQGHMPGIEQWQHSVRVSKQGNDTPGCLENSSIACQHLFYVFENVKDSMVVYVEHGNYTLNKSFTFWPVHNFAIIGRGSFGSDVGEVVINCEENAGLVFINSSGIVLKNITLYACGTIQNSTSIEYQQFKTGLFLVNCIDLTMDNVFIRKAPGVGMQLYDVAGNVSISNSHFINNGKQQTDDLEKYFPGGGFYFEFTYMGGLYPFDTTPEREYQENGSFRFVNVSFEGNRAADKGETVYPGKKQHDAFGRGGGASFFFKGSAQNNKFIFDTCHFDYNHAKWGAGLFVEFHDNTTNNSLLFKSCHFLNNIAEYGGGGIRIGLVANHDNSNSPPNNIDITFCHFEHNRATLGGGISLYGTTKHSYSVFHDQSFVKFTHCVIALNNATVGSAFCSAVWDKFKQYGEGGGIDTFKIYISHSIIKGNKIISSPKLAANKVSGSGAIYIQGAPIFLDNANITSNTYTALVLDSAHVSVSGNVFFINNTGQNGGGMALYGTSDIIVAENANLTFIGNNCSVKGGAIYVKTPGPPIVAFDTTELILHSCFFHFENDALGSVSFYDNKGPFDTCGHSVYATTLKFCRLPNESIVNNSALQQKTFHYYYANGTIKNDMKYEIVTDVAKIEVNELKEWNTTADKSFSPHVTLLDEKSNSVLGVLKIQVYPEEKVKLDPPSTYFIVQDEIKTRIKINAKPKTNFKVSLQTMDSHVPYIPAINAAITGCEPGFIWKESSCQCDTSPIGVSRCDDRNEMLYLLKDYWATSLSETFVVVQCPENYCYCTQTKDTSSGECLFDKNNRCKGDREDRLCGKCKEGFSLKLGEDECTTHCSGSQKWIGYLVAILIFLTLLVVFIMLINFDPFSAYLNAWLYFYQVLSILIPRYTSLDPFLTFIIGLANFQLIGVGVLCMWPGMDDLQKLGFSYILPLYIFICLCVLNKVVVKWPNNFITRRFTQTSLARAFCTLFVLSYSTVVHISMKILYPIKIGEKYYMYYQGTREYFSELHAVFFVIALFLLIFVGMFFPLVLIRRQCFRSLDNGLKKLLLDNFQRCFRDGYEWCAGFYFVCRFFLSALHIVVERRALQVGLVNSACCIIVTVFVFCRPYKENGGSVVPYKILNLSDAVLLCNLCLISNFGGAASGIYAHSYYKQFKTVVSILSYIPLVFSLGLLAYVLHHRYRTRHRLLENVDE